MLLTIKYGRGAQSVEIDDSRLIAEIASPEDRPLEDLGAAVESALATPIGPPLGDVIARGDRVLAMTVDHTRPNPSPMLWPLVDRIESLGGRPEIMIGLGNHPPMTGDELDGFIGAHEVHQNDSRAADQWDLGATTHGNAIEVSPILGEFDKRIVVGFIEPHYIAGFSGGRKMILPGVSSQRSITQNHFLTSRCGPQLGVLDGNPIHEDMQEAALAVGVDWICDAVVNPDDSFHSVHCGDLIAAHRRGARVAEKLYAHALPRRADIVVCSSGGHPYDVDMCQAKKALVPAMSCVRPGGAIILLGECEQGWGASLPDRDLLREDTVLAARAQIRQSLREDRLERQWGPCSPGLLFARAVYDLRTRLIVVSELQDELRDTYLHAAPDLPSALDLAEDRLGPDPTIIVIHGGRRAICLAPA